MIETMNKIENEADLVLICEIINALGTGELPLADEHSYSFFDKAYVAECIDKAIAMRPAMTSRLNDLKALV